VEELSDRKKAELRRIAELTYEAMVAVDAKMSKLAVKRPARASD